MRRLKGGVRDSLVATSVAAICQGPRFYPGQGRNLDRVFYYHFLYPTKPMESLLNDSAEQINSFIPGISIAPLQVLYYSEAKMEEPVTVMDAIKGIMCKRNKTFSIRCSLKRGVAKI